jgi:hypothetical protein
VALLAATLSPQTTQKAETPREGEDAVRCARQLLATAGENTREAIRFPFDSPERRRWGRFPAPRPGLAWKDMSDRQRRLVDELLACVLSDAGREAVRAIRSEQDLLGRDEEGLGFGCYWLAIYGEPGEGQWAWRFGGHHISLHFTYDGARLVSATPAHLGGEIGEDARAAWTGYDRLRQHDAIARRIIQSCDGRRWDLARIEEPTPGSLPLSEPAAGPIGEPEQGLRLSEMSPEQRRMVSELVHRYLSILSEPAARAATPTLEENLEKSRFAWAGSREEGKPHYYRLQAPGFLIEYANSGAHAHTLVRSASDWGGSAAAP